MQTSLGGCWSSKIETRIWGNVKVGKGVFVDEGVFIEASKEVTLGDNVVIGPRTMILNTEYGFDLHEHLERVAVSRGVLIGPGALICPGAQIEEDSIVCPGAVVYGDVPAGKIVSGNPSEILGNVEKAQGRSVLRRKRNHNFSTSFWVWIGAGAIVLSGVKLGKGSVVGAGAVVNDDVPENVVVLGNPAKSYKQRIVSDAVDLGRLLSFADERASPSKRLVNALKVGMIRLICR
jgi:acetyltransferase-like isoleucine patch superfamily enzyme